MNNNIIKSLRRTLLNTVAAAVVSIGFTACADEMFETQNSTAPANTYKISIPANIGGGDTRAIAYNSQTGGYDATFETTDLIEVYNVTKNAYSRKKSKYGGWDEVYLQPDANGKTANLVGELAFAVRDQETWSYSEITPEVGDELLLLYNNNYQASFGYDYWYEGNKPDFAMANAKIVSINDGLVKTSAASFENPQSLYKINFKGIGSDVKIKKVTISSKQEKLVCEYVPTDIDWPNHFSPVSYIYDKEGTDQHELIFMLRFADNPDYPSTSGDVISFVALGSDGRYYKGTKSVTTNLENGKYYQAEVAMENAGLAMTLINNKTGESVLLSNRWTSISTKEAGYTATNTAINTSLEWLGGDQALTLKGVLVNSNNYSAFIDARSDYDDPDNTKVHKLVLDGVNTLNTGLRIGNSYNSSGSDCSLIVSALSGGQLDITSGGIYLGTNATMTIQSGEVSVSDQIDLGSNNPILKIEGGILTSNTISANMTSSCVISGSGKFRVLTSKVNFPKEIIKPALGHILKETQEGNYTVWSVTEAPYEEPKNLSAASASDIGKIIGSDGKVYMPHWVPENVTPIGMIASITSTGHGLATAMKIVESIRSEGNTSWGVSRFSWDASGRDNAGKTATEIFNEWKVNYNVNFGTWRIPSKDDFSTIILGCKTNGDATEANDYGMTANGLYQKFVDAGTLNPNGDLWCWTSTEDTFVQDNITYNNMRAMSLKKEDNDYKAYLNLSISRSSEGYCILPVLEF